MIRAALLASLALAGCATTSEPRVVTREVKVPVPVSCVPESARIEPPAFPDTDAALKAAGGAADRYGLMAAGRKLRDQWIAEAVPVLRSCRSTP